MHNSPDLRDVLNKYGVSSVDEKDGGWTILMWAAMKGDKHTVGLLLDHGVDIETEDREHRTALFIAAEFRQPEMLEFLLERGADINTHKNAGSITPLAYIRARESVYRGTETGDQYAKIIKILETWPEIQKQRLEEQQKAAPRPKHPPVKRWKF